MMCRKRTWFLLIWSNPTTKVGIARETFRREVELRILTIVAPATGSKKRATSSTVIDLIEGASERFRKRQESQVAREARKKENRTTSRHTRIKNLTTRKQRLKELNRNFNSGERRLNVHMRSKSYSSR
jgi:cell division septum initiation protein DivIVA